MSTVHARPATVHHLPATATTVATLLRVAGAGLLATNAGIHAYLWDAGYRTIPTIGTLFLLGTVAASVLTIAVLITPRRWLPIVAGSGALLELGTVGGLVLSTQRTLFGFQESTQATLYWPSVFTEFAGVVVLAVLAGVAGRHVRNRAATSWW